VEDVLERARERWLNPASLRGFVLILAGLFILGFPNASRLVLAVVIAAAFVFVGVSDIWAEIRAERVDFRSLGIGIVWAVAGLFMIVYGRETVRVVIQIGGGLLILRGAYLTVRAITARHHSSTWVFDMVRGLLFAAAGFLVIILPSALTGAILVTGALGALIVGGILIAFGLTEPDEATYSPSELGGMVRRWVEGQDLGEDLRLEVADSLYFEEPDMVQKEIGFWTLLVLSEVIATLGILADSTAVVIGAMLVAPLMTPIMGASAAIVNGWVTRVATSFLTIIGGVAVAIGVAWITSQWAPHLVPIATNTQITSRVSPTMLDLMVAVAAGAAGAYTLVDRRVSNSIAGVAIAVALIPPLGVVGVTLQSGYYDDAKGAFLLFLTNLVSIILAASVVFLLSGFAPIRKFRETHEQVRTVTLTVVLGALVVMVPLLFTSRGIVNSATRQSEAQDVVTEWASVDPGLRVTLVKVSGEDVSVEVAGQGQIPPVSDLESELEDALGVDVSVTVEYFPSEIFTSDGSG
jgi:uncharacterized hydrophobic protein (TIGR00271 family)